MATLKGVSQEMRGNLNAGSYKLLSSLQWQEDILSDAISDGDSVTHGVAAEVLRRLAEDLDTEEKDADELMFEIEPEEDEAKLIAWFNSNPAYQDHKIEAERVYGVPDNSYVAMLETQITWKRKIAQAVLQRLRNEGGAR